MEMNAALYQKRQRTNAIGLTLSMAAMVLGLAVLLWILFVLFSNGLRRWTGTCSPSPPRRPAPKAVAWPTPSSAA